MQVSMHVHIIGIYSCIHIHVADSIELTKTVYASTFMHRDSIDWSTICMSHALFIVVCQITRSCSFPPIWIILNQSLQPCMHIYIYSQINLRFRDLGTIIKTNVRVFMSFTFEHACTQYIYIVALQLQYYYWNIMITSLRYMIILVCIHYIHPK